MSFIALPMVWGHGERGRPGVLSTAAPMLPTKPVFVEASAFFFAIRADGQNSIGVTLHNAAKEFRMSQHANC